MKVTLHAKRDFVDIIKLWSCNGEILSNYCGRASVTQESLYGKERSRRGIVREGDVAMAAEVSVATLLERNQDPKNAGSL